MSYQLDNRLVIGVSTRALFDLSKENSIFEKEGVNAYEHYQLEHETKVLKPGPGFALVKALLRLNALPQTKDKVEVIIMSKNSTNTSLRIFKSIEFYQLNISRAVLTSGGSLAPYLQGLKTDLFLSANESDVQAAINSNIAAGIICTEGFQQYDIQGELKQIRIAFDGDAVLFSDESEKIYQEQGLEVFEENERLKANNPLAEGPFAKFLMTISQIQENFSLEESPIRTALVTARSAPAHERVIRTLRAWNVRIDEAFFLGGIEKKEILKAFGANIFFDDQAIHTNSASEVVLSARVPYKVNAKIS